MTLLSDTPSGGELAGVAARRGRRSRTDPLCTRLAAAAPTGERAVPANPAPTTLVRCRRHGSAGVTFVSPVATDTIGEHGEDRRRRGPRSRRRARARRRRSSVGPHTTKADGHQRRAPETAPATGADGPAWLAMPELRPSQRNIPAPHARVTVTTATAAERRERCPGVGGPTALGGAPTGVARSHPSTQYARSTARARSAIMMFRLWSRLVPEQRQVHQHRAQRRVPAEREHHADDGDHVPDEPLRQTLAPPQPSRAARTRPRAA